MENWQSVSVDVNGVGVTLEVSDMGRVKRAGAVLHIYTGRGSCARADERKKYGACAYQYVKIGKNKKVRKFYVHRLVCAAFLGFSGLEVDHKNGVKTDNRLVNLRYVTHGENMRNLRTIQKAKRENGQLALNFA